MHAVGAKKRLSRSAPSGRGLVAAQGAAFAAIMIKYRGMLHPAPHAKCHETKRTERSNSHDI